MFILDGRPLSPDAPFEHDGVNYPANWLRLASVDEREAIGITEEPDPAPCDQRFYWAPGNPKNHADLVAQWAQQTRITAGTLLSPTDWYVVRELDNGTPAPVEMKDWRQAVRSACETKVAGIEATTTTEELASYIVSADYPIWPVSPAGTGGITG